MGTLESVTSITAEAMQFEIGNGAEVLDVRKPAEWSFSHLKNAQFCSLSDLPQNLGVLDKDKRYVVHCGGGYRSMIAISIMRKNGFKNLVNVYGGFGAMLNAGLEIVSEAVAA